jgi:hypothetical protein
MILPTFLGDRRFGASFSVWYIMAFHQSYLDDKGRWVSVFSTCAPIFTLLRQKVGPSKVVGFLMGLEIDLGERIMWVNYGLLVYCV